ncbi:hypothetical protein ASC75_06745 [Aminobacter sp. DSM 101952]|nr:hypothetical protein [Aminobacter sp. DSM 101952]KQU69841.1 hypothetical protein ASC75_06745 [Aminobacter sp. DSM 101952]
MSEDWRTAIEQAFECEALILDEIQVLILRFNQRRAYALADHLNSEFRGLAFASAACVSLHETILARVDRRQPSDQERRLSYPFYTDALMAAYNIRKFLGCLEMKAVVGAKTSDRMIEAFDQHLPATVAAADAIRHNHDRAFGRVRDVVMSERGQLVAVWGAAIKLTDHQLNDF